MIDKVLAVWNANPVIRDFVEGAVAAAVGGAVTGVLALSLGSVDSKTILLAAATGAVSAVIAYARRRLESTQTTTASLPEDPGINP